MVIIKREPTSRAVESGGDVIWAPLPIWFSLRINSFQTSAHIEGDTCANIVSKF